MFLLILTVGAGCYNSLTSVNDDKAMTNDKMTTNVGDSMKEGGDKKDDNSMMSSTTSSDDSSMKDSDKMSDDSMMDDSDVKVINVSGQNLSFSPNQIKVKKGDKVKIDFTSKQGFHDFVIDEFKVKTAQINSPSSTSVEFTANKTGTFEFYCSVGSHRAMGMVGKLIVE